MATQRVGGQYALIKKISPKNKNVPAQSNSCLEKEDTTVCFCLEISVYFCYLIPSDFHKINKPGKMSFW